VALQNELGKIHLGDLPPPSARFRALGNWLTSHKGQLLTKGSFARAIADDVQLTHDPAEVKWCVDTSV